MKPNTFKQILVLIVLVVLSNSCNIRNESSEKEDINQVDTNIILASTREVFNSIPSPVETAELINQTGVIFDEKILNPVKNVPYYETSQSMALNLGVYCADLSYTSFYDQKQITMEYLAAIKTLADGLNLVELLKQEDIIMLEDNIYNKDSIKILIKEAFFNSGQVLNDQNRPEIALMVEVGGWIEGMYLAMQLAKQSGSINKELVDRVSEQKSSLMLVIESLEKFSSIKPVNSVLNDMNRLKVIYDKMLVDKADKSKNSTILTSERNVNANITPEIFLELYYEINKIRNSYTQ